MSLQLPSVLDLFVILVAEKAWTRRESTLSEESTVKPSADQ